MYKVMKRYSKGPEALVGSYKTMTEAKKIIQEKLAEDAALKVDTNYRLYEGFDLVEEFDKSKLIESSGQETEETESQRGSGQTFNPSPFSASPQPKGAIPRSWNTDDKKGDDK
jgi:hypothetical protein